jgi:RimJ/RimL family protein N-acetyltransferase
MSTPSPFVLRTSRPGLPIRTERLTLRALTAEDADQLATYQGDAETVRFVPHDGRTAQELRERLGGVLGSIDLLSEHGAIVVGADLDGRIIGDLVLFHYQPEHGTAEMGWIFHRDVAGLGYATEAARALMGVAFDELGLRRITARIDELNVASSRLADRLGMRLEARLVENEWFKSWWSTEVDYAILDREWRENAPA